MIKNKIVLGADHNGVLLKSKIKDHLPQKGYNCIDIGPDKTQPSVDYPDFAYLVAKMISNRTADFGILICGTGIGMSIVANKIKSVRAALVHNLISAKKSKEHNDANIICLGAWINDDLININLVDSWLSESFAKGRHIPRINKIEKICSQSYKKPNLNM